VSSGTRHVIYHATLSPKVARLEHRSDARIYQDLPAPLIVGAVLLEAGITPDAVRFALQQPYPLREYCVQYNESDWTLLSGLLEDEGIFYFFESTDSGTRLVFADGESAHEPISQPSGLPFRPVTGALHTGEAVHSIEAIEQLHPGKVTLRDYNFKNPILLLE